MSSISPSSSASNEALPLGVSGLEAVTACLSEIRGFADSGCLEQSEVAGLIRQVFPAYHAYLRKVGAVASCSGSPSSSQVGSDASGSSTGVTRRSTKSGERFSALNKLKSWRLSGASPRPNVTMSGYCYMALLREVSEERVARELGPNPTLYSLMGRDVSEFRSIDELAKLSISGSSESAHLSVVRGSGNFLSELAGVASRSVPAMKSSDTLWHMLKAREVQGLSRFSGTTTLGALQHSVEVRSQSGYCYSQIVDESCRSAVEVSLGPTPTFQRVLQMPVSNYIPLGHMSKFGLVVRGSGFHVQVGDQGSGLDEIFGVLAYKSEFPFSPGTLGAHARLWAMAQFAVDVDLPGIELSSVLGASSSLVAWLSGKLGGLELSPEFESDVVLASKSAALHDSTCKSKLRMFEALGDAALTHSLARLCLDSKVTVQQYQAARSACTNNAALSALFVAEFDVTMFSYPSGVSPGSGAVGAKFVEALVGVVDKHFGSSLSDEFVRKFGILRLAGEL